MFCCFVFRGCRGNACPSESACTYDIAVCGGANCSSQSSRQCHKYYGVSCGAATTNSAAKPPVSLCDSKAYSSRQGAKKQPPIPHMKIWYRGLLSLSAPLAFRLWLAAVVRGGRKIEHPFIVFFFSNTPSSFIAWYWRYDFIMNILENEYVSKYRVGEPQK